MNELEKVEILNCLYQSKYFNDREVLIKVKNYIESLEESKKEIIKLYFGFYNGKAYTYKEIATMLGVPSYFTISRIVNDVIDKIRREFLQKQPQNNIKTIYEYLNDYTKEEVDIVLITLHDEELNLLTQKYGSDLEHPTKNDIWTEEEQKEFLKLIRRLSSRLLYDRDIIHSKEKTIYDYFEKYEKDDIDLALSNLNENDQIAVQLKFDSELKNQKLKQRIRHHFYYVITPKLESKLEQLNKIRSEKIKILEHSIKFYLMNMNLKTLKSINSITYNDKNFSQMLRNTSFFELIESLDFIQKSVIMLRVGNIRFSISSIADLLKISESEVVDIMEMVLVSKQISNEKGALR